MTDYYSKTLIPFVDRLIRENLQVDSLGRYNLDYSNLDDHDKQTFSAHMFECDDRDIYSISENKNYDEISSNIIRLLKNDSQDNKFDLADSIRNNMVAHYENKMIDLINDRLLSAQFYDAIENRTNCSRFKDNGELRYVG